MVLRTFGLERKHVISSSVKCGGRARKGGFETSDDLFFNYSTQPMSKDLTLLPVKTTPCSACPTLRNKQELNNLYLAEVTVTSQILLHCLNDVFCFDVF